MTSELLPKILIINDIPDSLSALHNILSHLETELMFVRSVHEAANFLGKQDFALILIDKKSAQETLDSTRLLRSFDATLHTPIVMILASESVQSRAFSFPSDLKGIDVIFRPTDPPLLTSKANFYLEFYAQRIKIQEHDKVRQDLEEQLLSLAQYDQLTGLPNRNQFMSYLNGAVARASRREGCTAVMSLDLDNFKNVNSGLGHDAGDILLQRVAARLEDSVRAGDLVARFGADEFGVILDDIAHEEDAARVAEKIIEAIKQPYIVHKQEVFTSVSIGIATYPDAGSGTEELFKAMDTALHYSKAQGRNNFQFFSSSMQAQSLEQMQLENDLRHALDRGELQVYYQPQVALSTGEIAGMEALVRWEHETLGLVGPDRFIPIAEESGLINGIGEWVLLAACIQNQLWQADAPVSVVIGVNVSIRQLQLSQFTKQLQAALDQSELSPECLEVELTESMVMDDPEAAIAILKEIHDLGIRIAIDDFGTGYSSLNYLRRLPIDTLKIDQSFIRDIGKDSNDEAIVKAIISMAHSLNLKVIAEGVESPEQLEFLKDHECDLIQGFYLSKPLSLEDATTLLKNPGPLQKKLGFEKPQKSKASKKQDKD